jgi:beta-mannosidase
LSEAKNTGGTPVPLLANDPNHGDRHTWDARLEGYRTPPCPRFISEIGQQSPSNIATLARVLKPEDLKLNADGALTAALEHRQRGTGGTARHIGEAMQETSRARGERPDDPADPDRLLRARLVDFAAWHALAQQIQAEAMRIAIEWAAENRDRCTGILIWQLNDAWPGMSWSLIDSDGLPKAAYFAVKEAFGGIGPCPAPAASRSTS